MSGIGFCALHQVVKAPRNPPETVKSEPIHTHLRSLSGALGSIF